MSKYDYQQFLSIGQHAVNMDFIAGVQFLNEEGFYMSCHSGYTKRSTPFPDYYSHTFRVGVATDEVEIEVQYIAQYSYGTLTLNEATNEYFLVGQSFSKVQLNCLFRPVEYLGVTLHGGYTLNGWNVGRAFELGTGFVYRFGGFPKTERVPLPEVLPVIPASTD
jgi:hypothetical protein